MKPIALGALLYASLPRGVSLTAHEIAAEVTHNSAGRARLSVRSAQRHLEQLRAAGLVQRNATGKPYGWRRG